MRPISGRPRASYWHELAAKSPVSIFLESLETLPTPPLKSLLSDFSIFLKGLEGHHESMKVFKTRNLNCNLLRPLIKILFLLVPYGYIIIKLKRIPKEMAVNILRHPQQNCNPYHTENIFLPTVLHKVSWNHRQQDVSLPRFVTSNFYLISWRLPRLSRASSLSFMYSAQLDMNGRSCIALPPPPSISKNGQ